MTIERRGFAGKVAFVTGAGSGIGRETALAFAREGASVVTRADDVRGALAKTIETFGRLDFAFNYAGVEQPVTPAADITEEEWDRIVDVDLKGIFLCMKHEIPLMLEHGGGVIVNTSSGAGVKGIAGQAAYCAAYCAA